MSTIGFAFSFMVEPVLTQAGVLYRDEHGNLGVQIGVMLFGVLTLVVGLLMADMLIDQVAKSAGLLSEPTYSDVDHSSARSMNGLLVMLYYVFLIILSLGMVGAGGYSAYKTYGRGGM